MSIYFDNAATTSVNPSAAHVFTQAMMEYYGNPSSTHSLGRKAKSKIEEARKEIAQLLNCSSSEIYFTSGGTESDNVAIRQGYFANNCTGIVSSPLEHHAVLNSIAILQEQHDVPVFWLPHDNTGKLDLDALQDYLSEHPNQFVSLMHVNNETGNLASIRAIGEICSQTNAIFHTDAVQSVGHTNIDLQRNKIAFLSASAHKFHGPKGVGILYVNNKVKLNNWQFGGGQEKGLRAGTENIPAILAMAAALKEEINTLEEHNFILDELKQHLLNQLQTNIEGVIINGNANNKDLSTNRIISITLPKRDNPKMLLFQLDMDGICLSGGSACQSGAVGGSHVIKAIGVPEDHPVLRISLSKLNTIAEIDVFIEKLKSRMA